MTTIELLKPDNFPEKKECDAVDWITEFANFLQGETIEGMKEYKFLPEMTPRQAFGIIHYLQEHFPILPDNIEMCSECNSYYDSHSEGYYDDNEGVTYCDVCRPE